MRKFTHLDALDHTRRRRSKAPLVLLFVLILVATPPMFEVGKMNLARFGLFGFTRPRRYPSARLPQCAVGVQPRRAPRLVDPAARQSQVEPEHGHPLSALPHFLKQRFGRVLNIGSMNAYCGERTMVVYSMCKGALMTMTRNLADAHGAEGIRINQLNVGWTQTPNETALKKTEGLPEDWPSRLPKTFAPAGRLLAPEDIAWAAVYFLSDEASLINGAILDMEQYPMIGRNPPKEID